MQVSLETQNRIVRWLSHSYTKSGCSLTDSNSRINSSLRGWRVGCAIRRLRAYTRGGALLRKPKGSVASPWNPRPGPIAPGPQGIRSVRWLPFGSLVWSLFGGLYALFCLDCLEFLMRFRNVLTHMALEFHGAMLVFNEYQHVHVMWCRCAARSSASTPHKIGRSLLPQARAGF